MKSHMLDRFKNYAMLCRLGGCFFVDNLCSNSSKKAKATWMSFYTLYSLLCVVLYLGIEVGYMVSRIIRRFSLTRAFTRSLLLILHTVITLKGIINFVCIVCGTSKLLTFFEESAQFEKSTNFTASKYCDTNKRRCSFIRRTLVAIALGSTYVIGTVIFVSNLAEELPFRWRLPGQIMGAISVVFFILYDSLPYVVLRGCCEVLAEYVHAQFQVFEGCAGSRPSASRRSAEVETIRLNLCAVRELKDAINDVWEWALVAMSASLVFVLCVVLYSTVDGGLHDMDVALGLTYSTYICLSYLEIAINSQAMKDEVSGLTTMIVY